MVIYSYSLCKYLLIRYIYLYNNYYKDISISLYRFYDCFKLITMDREMRLENTIQAMKALGEETRLRIMSLLAHSELNVQDIAVILGQSQPRISRHLKLLDDSGLIRRIREGNWVYCKLNHNTDFIKLIHLIDNKVFTSDEKIQLDLLRLKELKDQRQIESIDYFNRIARDWDQISKLHVNSDHIEKNIIDILRDRNHYKKIIDFGTGTGRMLEILDGYYNEAVGIDNNHHMLSIARSRIDALELKKCEIRYSDITKTLFSSNSVDLIIIHQVLHYFDNPSDVIKEASRLLKINGEVFIVDFSSPSIELLRSKLSHRRLGFSSDQMNELFEKNNIEVLGFRELKMQRDSINEDSVNENLTVTLWLGKKIR